ncbi:MAG: putative lipid II flippase FtsW [Elusimicrobia bacterium]|nr:putative lipid II flippase FtsW [Elusimicrobiota bacterium]MBD3412212.1 putative lipid II flippase FtsW [Elusimicrobiota bacterium]
MVSINRRQLPPDTVIMCLAIFFAMFGLIMIFSSSAIIAAERYGDSFLFLKRQLVWLIIGFSAMMVCTYIDYTVWQKYAHALVGLSYIFLITVLLAGTEVSGAQRWLYIGPVHFQPSEFAKLALVIGLADYCDRKRSKMQQLWKGYMPAVIFILSFAGLILLEKDLGTPVVVFSVGLTLLFLSAAKIRYLLGTIFVALPVLWTSIMMMPYRRQRILSFLNPWKDPQGSGYQIIQSLIAIGSGGITGKGLGASEAKLLYIPEPHTDFIFSIIGEELGLLGAVLIVGLYALFTIRGIIIAKRAPNLFGNFLGIGIVLLIAYQVMLNIAVVSGCLPTKGLTLPLLSFGGSSLVVTLASVGILLSISRYRKR